MSPQTVKSDVRGDRAQKCRYCFAGSSIGWLIWLATSNLGVAIGAAGPIAALSNNFLRRVIK